MAEQRNRTLGEGSPTGAFPSVRDSATPHEPEMPKTLPEAVDIVGGTGMFPIIAEGEDVTRQHDDSVSANAPDSIAPAPPSQTPSRQA